MQPRFEKRVGSAPFGLAEQARFRAAFDFMRLRADTGEIDEVLADWWEEFSLADDNLRRDMVDEVRLEQQQNARAARGPRARKLPPAARIDGDAPSAVAEAEAGSVPPADDVTAAPKKRRRRRRPGGGANSAGEAPTTDSPH